MARRTITLTDIAHGRLPDDLMGVRWPDGTVECRFNVRADDYLARVREAGVGELGEGEVLTDPSVECDRCADKCG
ncbi:MAG: hypothetical protein RL238_712 [Actinomycetota bacterium]|jgi:hypothetical protein